MGSMWYGYSQIYWRSIQARRDAYGQKLLAKGIIKNSNKWHKLMCRKGL